jgi:hypothetical protein
MEASLVDRAWAVVLPISSARALAALRLGAGLQVRELDDRVWVRGQCLDPKMRQRLLGLPAIERYTVGDDSELIPWGCVTPQARLPAGSWLELREWTALSLPDRGWPGLRPPAAQLRLIRSGRARDAGAILCSGTTWSRYAITAPQIRLEGLAFVVDQTDQGVILGQVLPPLPGRQLTDYADILVPAGWTWSPHVQATIVRRVFELRDGESALWLTSDEWQRIPGDAWVAATRSAVRETEREVSRG